MKKTWITAAAAFVVGVSAILEGVNPVNAATRLTGSPDIAVLVNGRKIDTKDGAPFLDANSRVQVPLRFVSEELGASLDWEQKSQTATIKLKSNTIKVTVNQNKVLVNEKVVTFDTKAISKKGRIFIPLRYIIDGFGVQAEWDQVGSWAWIGKKDIPMLEDAAGVKKDKVENYENLFKNADYLLGGSTIQKMTTAYVFHNQDFPMKMNERIKVYDMYKVQEDGYAGIAVRYSGPKFDIFFLTNKNESPRSRNSISGLEKTFADGTKLAVYPLIKDSDEYRLNIKSYKNFKISDIQYLGFCIDRNEMPLLINPFK